MRDAQLQKIPYIIVVGDREQKEGSVTVRLRNGKVIGAKKAADFAKKLLKEIAEKK